jgi:hypothetical protein
MASILEPVDYTLKFIANPLALLNAFHYSCETFLHSAQIGGRLGCHRSRRRTEISRLGLHTRRKMRQRRQWMHWYGYVASAMEVAVEMMVMNGCWVRGRLDCCARNLCWLLILLAQYKMQCLTIRTLELWSVS